MEEYSTGQIDYASSSNSNSIIMRILRSAMDTALEKLRFKDGPIEFLHEQTTFYELAAILVEGCLEIVEEDESEILESSSKILADLTEIRQWLMERTRDMKGLIREKDREYREKLEVRERESAYMYEEIEPGIMKNTVDEHQVEQKLEDENMILNTSCASCPNLIPRCLSKKDEKTVLNAERRSHSDPNLISSDSLDKQQGIVLTKTRGRTHASCPNFILRCLSKVPFEDVLSSGRRVRRLRSDPNLNSNSKQQVKNDEYMSSQMDILKQTLDLVLERMQVMDVLPLEKEWRRGVEREVESVSYKGSARDLQKEFDIDLKKRDKLVNDSWFDFIDEMKSLFRELKDFFSSMQSYPAGSRRTSSEPNLDVDFTQNLIQNDDDDDEVCGSPRVWEIVKSHESIIQKQSEQWNMLTKDALQREAMLSWIKRNEEINGMERLIQDALVRLENFAQRKPGCRNRAQEKRRRIPKPHRRRINRTSTTIQSFEAEMKKLQEERDGVMKDFSIESCCREKETASDEAEGSDTNQILMYYMESAIKDDIFVLVLHEMVKQWKYGPVEGEICYSPAIIEDYTEIHLREEIYKVYLREMRKGWRSQESKQFHFEGKTVPSSRGADGESSFINKDCEETEEQNTIEWLISDDDDTTFCSVSEKLERSLQQLYTSKELLAELEEDLELSDGGEDSHFSNMLRIQEENTSPQLQLEAAVAQTDCSENVLPIIKKFRFLVDDVEVELHENLESKFLRLKALKRQVDSLSQPVTWIRTRKLLYEKAFISRCRNLKLAETEVDLLGDQVEALLSLLERIYFALSRDAKVLSNYFEVHDILRLIRIELSGGRSFRAKS